VGRRSVGSEEETRTHSTEETPLALSRGRYREGEREAVGTAWQVARGLEAQGSVRAAGGGRRRLRTRKSARRDATRQREEGERQTERAREREERGGSGKEEGGSYRHRQLNWAAGPFLRRDRASRTRAVRFRRTHAARHSGLANHPLYAAPHLTAPHLTAPHHIAPYHTTPREAERESECWQAKRRARE